MARSLLPSLSLSPPLYSSTSGGTGTMSVMVIEVSMPSTAIRTF